MDQKESHGVITMAGIAEETTSSSIHLTREDEDVTVLDADDDEEEGMIELSQDYDDDLEGGSDGKSKATNKG